MIHKNAIQAEIRNYTGGRMMETPQTELEVYLRARVSALEAAVKSADERIAFMRARLNMYEMPDGTSWKS